MKYPDKCDNCRQAMVECSLSKFNSNYICGACQKKEQAHPDYRTTIEAGKRINNFKGIGKPSDL